MNELENGQPAEPEVYPLDDAAIEMIIEYERQVAAIRGHENAVLTLFVKQHKLDGNWDLRVEGSGAFRELVRRAAPEQQMMLAPKVQ